MVLPLIYAAGATVARYIIKNGAVKAAKKFTKAALSEGKKHADDVLKKNGGKSAETAANIKKMRPVQTSTANHRKTVRRAGLGGVAIGAVAATKSKISFHNKTDKTESVAAKSDKPTSKSESAVKPTRKPTSDGRTNPKDYPTYGEKTESAGSFRSATAAAKKSGKKTFTWEGRKYNTKEK